MNIVMTNYAQLLETASAGDSHLEMTSEALAEGHINLAHEIALEAVTLYPTNQELQNIARILAPPRVVSVGEVSDSNWDLNLEWLNTKSEKYIGKWVAILDGKLLETGNYLSQISESVKKMDGILLTRVH